MSEDQNLEGADTGEAVEGADLSWVPEKFRSNPEKFAEAYQNLEREYHSSRQEVKGLEDSIQSLSSQFEEFTAAQNRPDPTNVYNQWQEQYENDPFSTTLSLAQSIAQQTAQQILQQQQAGAKEPSATPDVVAFIADQTMGQKFEDWGSYKEKVADLIAEDPLFQRDDLWSSPQVAQRALESAYKTVKAEDVLSGAYEAVERQAADTRAMKLNAQTASGAGGRPPAEDDFQKRWQEIQNAESGRLGL